MSCQRQSQTPVCVSPSSSGSRPCFGLGSGSSGFGITRYGGLGYGGLGYGGGISSGSLGLVPGVTPSCVSQVPASEVVIQPPPFVVSIPGPVMAASCEPVAVAAHSPCASGYGMGGHGIGSLGMGGSLGIGGSLGMGSSHGVCSSQGYLGGLSRSYGSKRRCSFSW